MKRTLIVAFCTAGLLSATGSFAAPFAQGRGGGFMGRLDTNHDGKITRSEFAAGNDAMMKRRFDRLDTNGDGQVSFDEFKQSMSQYMDRSFDRLDANADGMIDSTEMQAARNRMGGFRRPGAGAQ